MLQRYTKEKHFNPFDVSKISIAACILCEWVLILQKNAMAMDEYSLTPMGLIPNNITNVKGLSLEFLRRSRGKKLIKMDTMLCRHYKCKSPK